MLRRQVWLCFRSFVDYHYVVLAVVASVYAHALCRVAEVCLLACGRL
jgi:hypothetical protein